MTSALSYSDPFFTAFDDVIDDIILPDRFTFPFAYTPHPLCLVAAKNLQAHLKEQQEWDHNFGLSTGNEGQIIGKMFGVLVVQTQEKALGYLAAFSGKLAGGNHHAKFVPPVFDSLTEGSFLNTGMARLTLINQELRELETMKPEGYKEQAAVLKARRKADSNSLQKELFDHYHFLNAAGVSRSLYELFENASYKNPPAGAGECAAPKLLQYAFLHHMKPLAMAEFWWGLSPKSATWKHGHFYPACDEKCRPILAHMLEGMELEAPAQTAFPAG